MTTATTRKAAGWLAWLSIGCLAGVALPPGPAPGQKELAGAMAPPADVPRIPWANRTTGAANTLERRGLALTAHAEATQGNDQGIPRLDAKRAADLEAKLQKLYAQLAPSFVRILNPDLVDERYPGSRKTLGGSGVIISPAGEILTCGHHPMAPKSKVVVEMADGRNVKATILGRVKRPEPVGAHFAATDFGMAVLDEDGPWPAAALGRPSDLEREDLCFLLGHPHVHKPGQPPLLRLGRVLSPHPQGEIRTTCRAMWGDSGAPLLDLEGRVLGVLSEGLQELAGSVHSSVDGFPKLRDRLRAGEEIEFDKNQSQQPAWKKEQWGAWEPTDALRETLGVAHQSTVEIRSDGKVIALGMIVDPDGLVLTKRSELFGPGGPRRLTCRLADGRQLEPRVLAGSREHDLALLNVPAKGLPAVPWGKSGQPVVGQLIASLSPTPQPLHYGVVGAVQVKNPATRGYLLIAGRPAPEGAPGMIFTKFLPSDLPIDAEVQGWLQDGDLITHLDDVPTPSAEEFVRVRERRLQAPEVLAGEWIKVSAQRKGKALQVYVPLIDSPIQVRGRSEVALNGFPKSVHVMVGAGERWWNLRMNGFPDVFSHDGAIAYNRCGGPVVNRSGQVIGINIARADLMQSFAIPSEVVRKVIAELKALPAKKSEPVP
jgi:S1-C subfamily serine protease